LGDDILLPIFISTAMLAAAVAVIVIIYFWLARASGLWPEYKSRPFRGNRSYRPSSLSPDIQNVGQQLNAVMAATFQKKRLLTLSEYRAFKVIEDEMKAMHNGHRVFAQTSLGEVLASPSSDAFHSINSKRIDILIVDRGGWPFAAFEYQGNGHYQGNAAGRDAIKKEALRKAGVQYIELSPSDNTDKIQSIVRELMGRKAAAKCNENHSALNIRESRLSKTI
jgi:hypothetical protein